MNDKYSKVVKNHSAFEKSLASVFETIYKCEDSVNCKLEAIELRNNPDSRADKYHYEHLDKLSRKLFYIAKSISDGLVRASASENGYRMSHLGAAIEAVGRLRIAISHHRSDVIEKLERKIDRNIKAGRPIEWYLTALNEHRHYAFQLVTCYEQFQDSLDLDEAKKAFFVAVNDVDNRPKNNMYEVIEEIELE